MSSSRRWSAAALIIAALTALACWSCGGGGEKAENAGQPSAPPAAQNPADTAATTGGAGAGDAEAGAKIYAARCALCHGPEGRGNGPGAAGLNPKPRNHHDQAYMHSRTDAQLLEVIHNGKGQMPAWKGVLTEAEMKQVLAYVRKLGETP